VDRSIGSSLDVAPAMLERRDSWLDRATTGAVVGVAAWVVACVIVVPLLGGHGAQWDAVGLRSAFPALVGWMFLGFVLGAIANAVIASGRLPRRRSGATAPVRARIVIVGGGFAGLSTASALEHTYTLDRGIEITLVSDTNALLFTPMLAEVADGSLEPAHIGSPLRTALRQTTFVRGRVTALDVRRRVVVIGDRELPYDHLVIALGAVSRYLGLTNVERHALDFKTLHDAMAVRDRVVEMFERADGLPPSDERRSLLTFVVAGGGFAGAELAGALNDFARGILAAYPTLGEGDVSVVVVNARDRILPELSASLAAYALARMRARGVRFVLSARVKDASATSVTLDTGEVVGAATLVWTAGTAPNPLVATFGLPCDKRGALEVSLALAVRDHPGIWALGDCAGVSDARTKQPCPPTAQFAIREASTVAENIRRTLDGVPLRDFQFTSLGALCVVGFQTACAELSIPFSSKSVRFSGFFAWLMWRGIYLAKLPGRERKLRVLIDWTIEVFFPRDIVQTAESTP